jgi:hypothetical protein
MDFDMDFVSLLSMLPFNEKIIYFVLGLLVFYILKKIL